MDTHLALDHMATCFTTADDACARHNKLDELATRYEYLYYTKRPVTAERVALTTDQLMDEELAVIREDHAKAVADANAERDKCTAHVCKDREKLYSHKMTAARVAEARTDIQSILQTGPAALCAPELVCGTPEQNHRASYAGFAGCSHKLLRVLYDLRKTYPDGWLTTGNRKAFVKWFKKRGVYDEIRRPFIRIRKLVGFTLVTATIHEQESVITLHCAVTTQK